MAVIFSLRLNEKKQVSPEDGPSSASKGFSLEGSNGAAVILCHGLTGTPNEVKALATHLNRKGYSIICPKLANHGRPLSVMRDTKWQFLYSSLREEFKKNSLINDAEAVFVAGLSVGALLSLLLADEFKDRIRGVSCLAPTLFYDGWNTPLAKYLLPLGRRIPMARFFYFKEEPPFGIKNEAVRERIRRYYSKASLNNIINVDQYGYPFFPITLLNQHFQLVKFLLKRLPFIETPIQLIQAKDDDVASVKNSKLIYDRVRSKMKEMILLYDSYHVITADQERDIVASKMESFFARILNHNIFAKCP